MSDKSVESVIILSGVCSCFVNLRWSVEVEPVFWVPSRMEIKKKKWKFFQIVQFLSDKNISLSLQKFDKQWYVWRKEKSLNMYSYTHKDTYFQYPYLL